MAFSIGGLSINNPLAITPHTGAAKAPAAAPKSNGYFWKGANGQVYVQGAQGIHAAGAWDGNTQKYWSGLGYNQTPNSPTPQPSNTQPSADYGSGNTSNGGGVVSSVVRPDKSSDIAMNNAGLSAVQGGEDAGIKSVEDAWNKANQSYLDDLSAADTSHTNETISNNQDLQANKQASLERAVQGRQGLFGTLAGLGALNGTGIELANHAVQQGANEDLTTAANTHATNQSALDTSYNQYTQEEKRQQKLAQDARDNNEKQVHNDAIKSRQQYLTGLANDYDLEGNAAQRDNYTKQAAALFPSIQSTNVPTISIASSGGAYAAPTLSQYVGKANNTSVQTTPGQSAAGGSLFNIPGLIALNKKSGT